MIGWTDSQHWKPSKLLLLYVWLCPISWLQDPVGQTRWRGTTAINQAQNSVLFTAYKSKPSAWSTADGQLYIPPFLLLIFSPTHAHIQHCTYVPNTCIQTTFMDTVHVSYFNILITSGNCVIKERITGEVVSTMRVTTRRAQSTDHRSITQLKHSNHKGKKV